MAGLFSGAAARRRKRQPGRARSPAKSQPGGQWQFGVDERGKGTADVIFLDKILTRRKFKIVKQSKIWRILRDVLIVAVLTGLGGFILGFGAIVRAQQAFGNVQGVPLRQRAQQEATQQQIYALNEDVMSKSNILQRILSPQSPYKIEQYHYRT